MDDYIDQWNDLQDKINALKLEQDALASKLMENMSIGEVLVSTQGNKVRKCDRGNVVAARLKDLVTPAMWVKITERKPVAALYKAEVKKGKLDQSILDAATDRTQSWIEKR